jgi:hypothetical protein
LEGVGLGTLEGVGLGTLEGVGLGTLEVVGLGTLEVVGTLQGLCPLEELDGAPEAGALPLQAPRPAGTLVTMHNLRTATRNLLQERGPNGDRVSHDTKTASAVA